MSITLPNYTITDILNEGIYTIVYRGYRHEDGSPAIIKVLRREYPDLKDVARLHHEYQISGRLHVAGIVRPWGIEHYPGGVALILEDFGGQPLNEILANGPLPLEACLKIGISLATTLGELHAKHVIHKDIKPHNIIVNLAQGQVKLTDFGLATEMVQQHQKAHTGVVMEGTLAYMSPEQTGRMNRSLDYRTDFYSLGVTLYEIATGVLPFLAGDAMEMVHAHLARQPVPPHTLMPSLPPIFSALVLKLMAKTAEERYQSAWGVRADLEECLAQWETTGTIEDFPLGRHDVSDMFHIPQKLYGRHAEVGALLSAFDRTSIGRAEVVVVAGYSGIGKTALINEIHKPITRQRGYFISGKFDQLQRSIPYSSLIQAFRGLVRQLLAEGEAQLAWWREALGAALGPNGRLIIDVIPEVALILGEQPPVTTLGFAETQNRFLYVFRSFVHLFAQPQHPLVLFLDDLQWADPASLKLIQSLATDPDLQHFLLLGAYRDHEVDAAHPLMLVLDEIKRAGVPLSVIEVAPLGEADIGQLVADTLCCGVAQAAPLAVLVYEKTAGNPFFLNQFLQSLYSDGLIRFDAEGRHWHWDLDQIRQADITDNVVDLMANKLQRLSAPVRHALMLGACIGNQFDLDTLALVGEKSPSEMAKILWEAVREGLLLPLDADYKYLQPLAWGADFPLAATVFSVSYKFLHDRVQQAAYSLLRADQEEEVHLTIGRLLLAKGDPTKREEGLFEIVNHLNLGRRLIGQASERETLARLNVAAGQKAKASTAYRSAADYLRVGMELLPAQPWAQMPTLTSALYRERAICEYLSGEVEEAERLFDALWHHAASVFEKADVLNMRMVMYTNLGRFSEAVQVGLAGLALFGVDLYVEKERRQATIQAAQGEIVALLAGRPLPALLDAPALTDETQRTILTLLMNMAPAAYFLSPNMTLVVVLQSVRILLRYGHTEAAPYFYMTYGLILVGIFQDYAQGYAFAQLALQLNDKIGNTGLNCKLYQFFGANISYYRENIKYGLEYLEKAYYAGIESGDFIYLAFSCTNIIIQKMGRGDPLDEVYQELLKYLALVQRMKDRMSTTFLRVARQMILSLQGHTQGRLSLNDETFEERRLLQLALEHDMQFLAGWYYAVKLQLCYLYEAYDEALAMAQAAERVAGAIIGVFYATEIVFYGALTVAAVYSEAQGETKAEYLERLQRYQAQLKHWAANCPANFGHKYLLIQGEMARLQGDDWAASEWYDQAIAAAHESGFWRNEALANEVAGRFYMMKGKVRIARLYLTEACYGYERWGARAKVAALQEQYPLLLAHSSAPPTRAPGVLDPGPEALSNTTLGTERGELLDVASVIKASQTISREIVLENLLQALMTIALENAGAQRGFLIRPRDETLVLQISLALDGAAASPEPRGTPITQSQALCVALVHFVARTQEAVVLHDATQEGNFVQDPYILARRPKSVLCMPLINRGQLEGVLYLENNLTTHAFTPDRVRVLGILAAQAAISIENAMLYRHLQKTSEALQHSNARLEEVNRTLEQKVLERTAALEQAMGEAHEAREVAEQANSLKTRFLANMSHELRTPLNSILNFVGFVVDEVFGPLSAQQQEFLTRSLRSGEHLLGLINDILDLSKIEAGKMELFPTEVDLRELCQGVMSTAVGLVATKPIELALRVPDDLPLVWADPIRIRQVLLNMVSNAAKFTHQGSITLAVVVTGPEVVVSVADSGIGIAPEDQEAVFAEFEQVGAHAARSGGTGLGMAISKRFVEMHGGRMWLESELNMGTTLFFTIPLRQEHLIQTSG